MGTSIVASSERQGSLLLATAAAVVGVLAGVLLTVGYGEAISALVEGRAMKSLGMTGAEIDEGVEVRHVQRQGKRQREMNGQRGEEEGRSGVEGTRGGLEMKRDVKEGIEGCIGITPLIRLVSRNLACVRACVRAYVSDK